MQISSCLYTGRNTDGMACHAVAKEIYVLHASLVRLVNPKGCLKTGKVQSTTPA